MMPTDGEFLFNLRATGASLAGVSWIDFYQLSSGARSLVRQHEQKRTPRHIVNLFREKTFAQSDDVQLLNHDHVIFAYQCGRELVLKILSLIENLLVDRSKGGNRLSSAMRSLLSSRYPTLSNTKFLLCGLVVTPVIDLRTVAKSGEGFDADINADLLAGRRKRPCGNVIAREDGEPFRTFPFQDDLFDLSLEGSGHLDFQVSNQRDIQFSVSKSVTRLIVNDRVEKRRSLKPRESRFLPSFNSTEERDERFIQHTQGLDHCSGQYVEIVGIELSDIRNLFGLIGQRDAHSIQSPRIASLTQRGVIEIPEQVKRVIQALALSFAWVNSVLIYEPHLGLIISHHKGLQG